jgi:hypothetical protein
MAIVSLDPVNETFIPIAVDISSLITLDDVIQAHGLGPNGGILYRMEHLEANFDWLERTAERIGIRKTLRSVRSARSAELSTHHDSVKNVMQK